MAYVLRLALELNRRTLNTQKLICNEYSYLPQMVIMTPGIYRDTSRSLENPR